MESLWIGAGQMIGAALLVYFGGKRATHALEGAVKHLQEDVADIRAFLGMPPSGRKNGKVIELGRRSDDPLAVLLDDKVATKERS